MNEQPQEIVYQRPPLYGKQAAAMFDPRRISVIEASTKSGKTVSAIIWLYEQALQGQPGQNFWWVAPVSMQSRIAFNRMRQHFTDQDGRPVFTINLSDHTLTTLRGTVIAFRSGDHPDTLYGEDVHAAVIDEASRFKQESWHAIRSTLTATRGPMRIIGNVKGRKNWFYQLARQAEQGMPNFGYHRLTAQDAVEAGVLAAEEIESARAMLPEHVFKELYYAEPSDDEGNPFGAQHIRACYAEMSERPAVAWGWDLARKMDWTVGIGIDADGRVCEALRFQKPWHEQVDIIKKFVGNNRALVDETGVGDPIIEAIKLPVRRGSNGAEVIELSCPRLEGYRFTMASKQMLMEGLALAIHERKVSFPEGPISIELMNFEYEFCLTPETPVLTHDLCHIPVGDLKVGDGLLAFDEEPPDDEPTRFWRHAVVTGTGEVKQPCYRIVLDDGTEFVASAGHRWLTMHMENNRRHTWRRSDQLRAPSERSASPRFSVTRLVRLMETWKPEQTFGAGYMAGVFDGEGWFTFQDLTTEHRRGGRMELGFAQKENIVAVTMRSLMHERGFNWSEREALGCIQFNILGGWPEYARFLGTVRPRRLMEKWQATIPRMGILRACAEPQVELAEFIGEREVTALATSTGTLIANGIATHNTRLGIRYSAPAGMHDDCVCALALAWRCFDNRALNYDSDLGWIGVE